MAVLVRTRMLILIKLYEYGYASDDYYDYGYEVDCASVYVVYDFV